MYIKSEGITKYLEQKAPKKYRLVADSNNNYFDERGFHKETSLKEP